MTEMEAALWAQESAYAAAVYHVTAKRNLAGLAQKGFDLGRANWGRVWGNGVYAATDAETRRHYETWQGYDAVVVELRINLRRFFTYDASQRGTGGMPDVIAGQFLNGTARYAELLHRISARNSELRRATLKLPAAHRKDFLRQNGYESFAEAAALTALLQAQGYDALLLVDHPGLATAVGGNQIVVFDPQNVVIVKG